MPDRMQIIVTGDVSSAQNAMRSLGQETGSLVSKIKQNWLEITAAVATAYAAYSKVSEAVNATEQLASETYKLQKMTGMTAESASEIINVAHHMGIGFDTLQMSLIQVVRRMGGLKDIESQVTDASGETVDAFEKYHIVVKNADGSTKSLMEVFNQIRERIHGARNETEQLQIATQFFVRGGAAQLLPLLAMSDGQWKALAEDAKKYGLILSQNNVNAVREYVLAHRDLDDAILGLKLTIGQELIPVLKDSTVALTESIKAVRDFTNENRTLLSMPFDALRKIKEDADELKLAITSLIFAALVPWILKLGEMRIALALTAAQVQALGVALGLLAGYELGKLIDQAVYKLSGGRIDITGQQRLNEVTAETAEQFEYLSKKMEKGSKILQQLGFIGPNAMKEFKEAVAKGEVVFDKASNSWKKLAGKEGQDNLKGKKAEIDGIGNAMLEWQRKIEALNPELSKAENKMAEFRTEAVKLLALAKQKGVDTGFIFEGLEKVQGYIDAAELEESNDAAAKAYGEDYANLQQNLRGKESLDRELTKSRASELEKRLLDVVNWAKDEEEISYKLYEADGISWEEHEKNKTIITQAAADQRKQITLEVNRAIEEAEIQHQLALVDIQEKNFIVTPTEAVEKRLSLYQSELDKLKEGYAVASQIKGNDEARRGILTKIDQLQVKIADELQKQKELTGTFTEGMSEGFKQYLNELKTKFQQGADFAKTTAESMRTAFSDIFFDAMQGKMKSWYDYWTQILSAIEKKLADMLAQWMLFGESGGGGGGGGLLGLLGLGGGTPAGLGGGIPGSGWEYLIDMPKHTGGIVGRHYIPKFHFGGLNPDERVVVNKVGERYITEEQNDWLNKVAETVRGGGGSGSGPPTIIQHHYHINAIDAQSFAAFAMKNKSALAAATMSAGANNHPIRRS